MSVRLRVLVVEDNALNRQLVRDVLELRGHEVLEAEDVPTGLALALEAVPDVAVLDIQLPGGGGEALARALRREPRLRRLPLLAVTAYAMPGDRERFLAAGFDGYLSKPIDTRAFGPTVEAFCAERSGGGDG
ncbi:MAG: response regulator [Deltaproteobacteria bacterium]|nr:response regulator [Deltaproteobacteria bacterium]